jgi:hypothetical protein
MGILRRPLPLIPGFLGRREENSKNSKCDHRKPGDPLSDTKAVRRIFFKVVPLDSLPQDFTERRTKAMKGGRRGFLY